MTSSSSDFVVGHETRPVSPSKALPGLPDWAVGMVRVAPAETAVMSERYPDMDVHWREGRGFRYALLMGLTAVAFDGLRGHSVSIADDVIREARSFVLASSQSPFDLRVFAFPSHVDLMPDDINKLAQEQIVVARNAGTSATERAEAFIDDFRRRAQAERENFDAFAEQTEALRRRVEASRKG